MASNEDPTEAEIVAQEAEQEAERASSRPKTQGSIGGMIADPDTDTDKAINRFIADFSRGDNTTTHYGTVRRLNRASRGGGLFPEHWTDSEDVFYRLRELQKMGLAQAQQLWPNYENVVELSLPESTVDSDLLFVSELFPKLSILDLQWCSKITNDGLAHLARCTMLSKLNLRARYYQGKNITDPGLAHLAQCKMLSKLNLRSCDKITDWGLAELAHCKMLSELNLWYCLNITDAGLAHLAQCKMLSNLNLRYCRRITDAGLEHLPECPRLTNLDLSYCYFTDAGLESLARCKMLSNLKLEGCRDITGAGLAHLAHLKQLSKLHLDNCRNITDAGLESLAHGCPQLFYLNLSCYGSPITDAGLESLAHCKMLSELNLWGCDKITGAGLLKLQPCTQLKILVIKKCTGVKGDETKWADYIRILRELFIRIPSLERIYGVQDKLWNPVLTLAQSVSSLSSFSRKFVETLKLRF